MEDKLVVHKHTPANTPEVKSEVPVPEVYHFLVVANKAVWLLGQNPALINMLIRYYFVFCGHCLQQCIS